MFKRFFRRIYQRLRKIKYGFLSENNRVVGVPISLQPVQFAGEGEIIFGSRVILGYYPSPFFYNGVIYLEARNKGARIKFGSNVFCNNNLVIICDKTSIEIGDNVLIGSNVEIIDSDFHEIHPGKRNSGNHKCKPVVIEDNVFIGSNVRILKGVTVGKNSIIANGAIVISNIPENVIAAGNPASVIKAIDI